MLYETYRTEKLSRTVHSDTQDSSILPEELASQSVRLKEEQLRREEEKVRRVHVLHIEIRGLTRNGDSCARSSSVCSARSTRRGRSCWQRKSRSGEYLTDGLSETRWSLMECLTRDRNLESRLAAQGSQSEFRE